MRITLDDLRQFTVARNFNSLTSLQRLFNKIGFVQADPIRAPTRAQDLILRHRVKNYRTGDLERFYEKLDVEEDFFVNYGYVTKHLQKLMHPRSDARVPADVIGQLWSSTQRRQAKRLLKFVRERGIVHPREVDDYFAHGKVTNYWGGSSNSTTHLLGVMHYCGMLRVVRREKGIRIYASHDHERVARNKQERRDRMDQLVDVLVRIYAPLTAKSLSFYVGKLRYAAPQWQDEVKSSLTRAKERLAHANINGVEWFWNCEENPLLRTADETVRLLAPFDPVVHDRWRFELLWGWTYRFEAYTPAAKRKLGYYAMPMLWRDRVVGWSNVSVRNGKLEVSSGFVDKKPREKHFDREFAAELERMKTFLRLNTK